MLNSTSNKKTASSTLEFGFFFLICIVMLVLTSGVYYNSRISHAYYNASLKYELRTSSQQILFSLITRIDTIRENTIEIYQSKNKKLNKLTLSNTRLLAVNLRSLIKLLDHIRNDQELPELQQFIQNLYREIKSHYTNVLLLVTELQKDNYSTSFSELDSLTINLKAVDVALIKIHQSIDSIIKAETIKQKNNATIIIQDQYIILIILPLLLAGFALYGGSISSNMRTEIKIQTNKLLYEKERALHANNAKNEFIRNMSHEFMTPLHSILSFSKLGLKNVKTKPEKIKPYFERIISSGNQLFELITTLLDISKLESRNEKLEPHSVNMYALLKDCNNAYKDDYKKHDLHVEISLSNNLNNIDCDSDKIKSVILNLIDNAVKYSPKKSYLVISASILNDHFLFSIEDTGPGIPDSELEAIFDKFTQSTTTNTGAGGTGLGLCLCKEFILLHQGRIWVENIEQGGAKFSFKIPLHSPYQG